MKLQKSTSIALCSLLEAATDPARQVVASEVAHKYGVSVHHLAKVLRLLGRAGLLESSRGVGGGYRFVGNARRTTLLDVVELFEDISARPAEGGERENSTDEGRGIARVLDEIDQTARAVLGSITIATMLKIVQRERRGSPH
ncbi:MAG: Rrf2 family transcriptional regulator [Burkholderiaceae bacterium]|nr:Rrf2 family transcriptional regulator [Burkholderiaceae bacterium]